MRRPGIAIAVLFGLLLSLSGLARAGAEESGWSALLDEDGSLQLADIRSAAAHGLLEPASPKALHTDGGHSALWLHRRLQPGTDESLLKVGSAYLSYLDLYLMQGDTLLSHVRTGSQLPFASRPLPSRDFLLPLATASVPTDLYLRLASEQAIHPHLQLDSATALAARDGRPLLEGLLIGSLLMLLLQSLLRLARTRQSSSLWLAISQASLLCSALGMLGVLGAWLGDRQPLVPLIVNLGILIAAACAMALTLSFFRKPALAQPVRKLLVTEMALMLPVALTLLVVGELQHMPTAMLLAALTVSSCLAAAMTRWRQGRRAERLFACGMLAPLPVAVAVSPALLGFGQLHPDWLADGLLVSAIASGILLSLALSEARRHTLQATFSDSRALAASSAELRVKTDFLGKISHEIRTPLNGVLGMTELLLGTSLSAKQRDYVQTIHGAGNELLTLLNEILDISRLESGQIELNDVQFDLNALVEECLALYHGKAEEKRLELISFVQPQVPRIIAGDPARLRQALLALLDNAFRQTEEGEILLVVALDASHAAPHLRIAVQDSGRPLALGERDALLNAQLDSKDLLDTSRLGTRLGLIVARQLVCLMGGEFGIQAGGPQGNTLWLTLPLDSERPEQAADLEKPLQGARLLVVDDNDTCRKVLQQQCSAWGMNVSAVASGKEALALLRTRAHLGDYFDAVLLDQQMPGMTGLQLATKIKEDPNLNHDILIVMLTGISNAPSKITTRNAGIKRILAKPVAGYTLRTTLADELGQRGAPSVPCVSEPLQWPADFRVLVAEDDGTSTKVIRGMLGKLNLQPDTATNGREALEALKRQRYDLVLMDCEMPVLDGFSATLQLREWERREQRQRTPVVALTAHILSEHRERARQVGMDGHMAKPVELSQLRETVAYWVGQKQQLHDEAAS